MKIIKPALLGILCLSLGAILMIDRAFGSDGQFGKRIEYSAKQPVALPGLSIRFLGKRVKGSSATRLFFTFYDFEVKKGSEAKTISWTSGTGSIAPKYFDIGGESYALELKFSFDGTKLKEGEMILWRKDQFDRMLASHTPAH